MQSRSRNLHQRPSLAFDKPNAQAPTDPVAASLARSSSSAVDCLYHFALRIALDQQLVRRRRFSVSTSLTSNLIDVDVPELLAPSVEALLAHALTFGDLTDWLPIGFPQDSNNLSSLYPLFFHRFLLRQKPFSQTIRGPKILEQVSHTSN